MKGLVTALYTVCIAAGLTAARANDTIDSQEAKTPPASTAEHKAPHADHKRPALTAEQKAARKELVGKYDANKDGKLDKEERSKITSEDKAKLKKKVGQAQPKAKAAKKEQQ